MAFTKSPQVDLNDMLSGGPKAVAPKLPVKIEGVVSRVVYSNNGFVIFAMDIAGQPGKSVSVKGSAPSIAKGMRVEISGEMVIDPKFGEQFSAKSIAPVIPKALSAGGDSTQMSIIDNEELASYLGSGFLPGVGPVIARKIIEKFGADTTRVLEKESYRLTSIRGINDVKAGIIREAWIKNIATHEVYMFLNSHGLSLAKAADIVSTFGGSFDRLKARIIKNPYMICDVDGVGFKTADSFAASLGIVGASPERVKRGIEYVFMEDIIKGTGSTGAELTTLLKISATLLGLSQKVVLPILEEMIERDGRLIEVDGIIFLRSYYEMEQQIASDIARLMAAPHKKIDNIEEKINRAEAHITKGEWKLTDVQRAELVKLLDTHVNILTGFPGTGKTTILSVMLHVLKASGSGFNSIMQGAPSGKAAKRMQEVTNTDSSTCHRLLGFEEGDFVHDRENPLPANVINLDEWSMADVPLMAAMLKAAPSGTRLLFIGDDDQLSSVGPGRVFGDMIGSKRIPVARLTDIRRQGAGSRISIAAKEVNQGIVPSNFGDDLSAHLLDGGASEDIATMALNKAIELISTMMAKGIDLDDIQVLTPMKNGECGTNKLNASIQSLVNKNVENPQKRIKVGDRLFAIGDRVMQLKNDYDLDIFNGDSGKITHIDTEEKSVFINFGTQKNPFNIEITSDKLQRLDLYYAGTIHKSQGSEFKHVIMPVIPSHYVMLKKNIVYTGMTRGRESVSLIMDKQMRAMHTAVKTEDSTLRLTSLKSHLMACLPPLVDSHRCDNHEDAESERQFFDDVPM